MHRVQLPQRSSGKRDRGRGRQLEAGKNHAQKKPGSKLLVDDAGVLSDPADSCVLGVNPLYQGTGIHIAAGRKGTKRLLQTLLQLLEAGQQDIVVIARPPGRVLWA